MSLRGLRAVTVAIDEPLDLVKEAGGRGLLWREETAGMAGTGVAARLDLPHGLADPGSVRKVSEMLASIEVDDDVGLPGSGPVAIGALPFDPAVAGQLTIPRRIVGRSGNRSWLTTISGPGLEEFDAGVGRNFTGNDLVGEGLPGASPDEFKLNPSMSHAEWMETVADAVEALERGDLRKVVLARRVDITANRPFVVPDVLERLTALYPSCMIFSVGGFLGASPELLIRRNGRDVESHPLAGTVARSGDAHGDEALVAKLMGSPKARHEHAVVVDALASALAPLCAELDVPDTPSVLGLRNVSHLATRITGRLAGSGDGTPRTGEDGDRPPTALELVSLVHPTPAVGGEPTEPALRYMQKVEGFDRGCYAGPVGWTDARGNGAWAYGIRSAEVQGARARIYAGNGIVAGSDPREELAETQLKLQALLAALVRP
jgi:menaquinone-specific isochorismate synthase